MPLLSETIPNRSLNGEELKQVILNNVREVLDTDCFFAKGIAYRRASFSFTITAHCAGLQHPVIVKSRMRPKVDDVVEGEPPLQNPVPDPEDSQFMAVQRDVEVSSPNLTRIHNSIPIRTERAVPGDAGSPFAKIEHGEVAYDLADFEPLPKPKDTDVTEREAKKLGVNTRKK